MLTRHPRPQSEHDASLTRVADVGTIAELSTGVGTLALAAATFGAVRSSNRAARVAERSLLVGIRPVLFPSRAEDPPEKVIFGSPTGDLSLRAFSVKPGTGLVEIDEEKIYLAIPLRNVGSGLAVLLGWHLMPERPAATTPHAEIDEFRTMTRDQFIPAGDHGFWQAAIRDPDDEWQAGVREAIARRGVITIEVLYGDHEGGQRTISRFAFNPRHDSEGWMVGVIRHWSLDVGGPPS
jgi:hypothetical protein